MGYTHGIRWTDQEIEKEIKNVINALCIERMPTRKETVIVTKSNSLNCAICRTYKYSGWAKRLGLSIGNGSDTWFGKMYEEKATNLLMLLGYKVERMPTKHPYDLLLNDAIKIDVKAAKPYVQKNTGNKYHTYNLEKRNPTCDIYLLFALDDTERIFIIPSLFVNQTQIGIGKDSKYNKFMDRWDYIKKFDHFYLGLTG